MSELVTQTGTYSKNFLTFGYHIVLIIGLFITVISLGRIALKFMAIKKSDDKIIASYNLLDVVLGVISLGVLLQVVYWAVSNLM